MDNYKLLVANLGFNRVKLDEPLAPFTYIKVGGSADILYISNNKDELSYAVKLARKLQIHFTILGCGGNVLISDKGIRGLVIINRSNYIKFLTNGFLEVDSGVTMTELIKETTDRLYTGLERMLKVPATVGGAVVMNAGHTAKKEFFGDLVVSVEVLNQNSEIKKIMKKDCNFSYRASRFQTSNEIILGVMLHLEKVDKKVIEEKVLDILVIKQIQPAGPTMGSTFRNPEGFSAGFLLDEAGLKGKQVGSAKISEKHANFIINTGSAKATDIQKLLELMREKVRSKFNIELVEEIKLVGDW